MLLKIDLGFERKKIRGLLLKLNLHNLFLLDMMVCCYILHNMVFALWEKMVFCNWPCNSQYLYDVSVIGQVGWSARVAIHHIYNATHCNSIIIQLWLCRNNSFLAIMQLIPLQLQP
jgi:hypothetical protein